MAVDAGRQVTASGLVMALSVRHHKRGGRKPAAFAATQKQIAGLRTAWLPSAPTHWPTGSRLPARRSSRWQAGHPLWLARPLLFEILWLGAAGLRPSVPEQDRFDTGAMREYHQGIPMGEADIEHRLRRSRRVQRSPNPGSWRNPSGRSSVMVRAYRRVEPRRPHRRARRRVPL